MRDLKLKYERIKAVREWNARFRTPPVCTKAWKEEDWNVWFDNRKPLPPFKEWVKTQKP